MEEEMLLSANEVIVTPGGFRLFDFVSPWVELRTIERPPSLDSMIFAILTLGMSRDAMRADTNGFTLSQILEHKDLHKQWKDLSSKGMFEQGFLEFLLRYLQGSNSGIRLEFPVRDGRLKGFVLNLGSRIQLLGRFPEDVDVLPLYFEQVEALQD